MAHTLGQYKIYTRRRPGDSWTERTQLRMASGTPTVLRSAGQITVARIAQTYGPGSEAAPYVNWTNHWVRITLTPSGGAETDVYFGHMSDQTLNEAAREVIWGAISVEAQLRNVILTDGFATAATANGNCEEITLRPFNENLDPGTPIGWRGNTLYHFTRDSTFKTKAAGGADTAYAFGLYTPWNAWQAIRTLIRTHFPQGGSRYCAIGFDAVATSAAQTALEAIIERWNFLGKDAWTTLHRLVRAAGDLDWTVDWSTYGYDFPEIRIFSKHYDDRDTGWQDVHNIAGGGSLPVEALSSKVTISVKDRVTQVTALGAPIKIQFTSKYTGSSRPMYRRGWTDADEAAAANLIDSDDPRAAALNHVYRRLYLPADQTSGGASTWHVFQEPVAWILETEFGDMLPVSWFDRFYAHPRRILPRNLTMQGYAYTGQSAVAALSASDSGVLGEPEHDPILCWFNPAPATGVRPVHIQGVESLRNATGVLLPEGVRMRDKFGFRMQEEIDGTPNWQELVITLSIETDVRLAWTASDSYALGDGSGIEDSQRRTLVVEVPDAEWWAILPETVIKVSEAGAETTLMGVLRNDWPKLKDVAEKTLARYSNRAWHADIQLVTADPAIGIGHFVGTYGPFTLNNPILALEQHLGLETVGTKLITGRPWERRRRI